MKSSSTSRRGPREPLVVEVAGSNPENLHRPAKPGDVGYDLAVDRETTCFVGQITWARTGVRLGLPQGMWAEIIGRSSTAHSRGLVVMHSVIDTGYTGELTVGLLNVGAGMQCLPAGTRIAQLIFRESVLPRLQRVLVLGDTERGDQGFGSTGTGA